MCFSATASFVAGGVLSATGIVTLAKTKKKSHLPFASIPLLFGIQQCIEGFVWLSVVSPALPATIATYAYLAFSHVLWPLFIPFSVLLLERESARKRALKVLMFLGLGVALYLLYFIIIHSVTVGVVNHSIAYLGATTTPFPFITLAFYLIATCGSCFVSSHKLVRLFGALALVSFFIAGWFYRETFFSVWCFFSAVLSVIVVYWQITQR